MTGLRVAFHAGQLLQPVPGGIGRYERAMLAHLPALGIGPVAFAAGPDGTVWATCADAGVVAVLGPKH